jgi:hypothetical protein
MEGHLGSDASLYATSGDVALANARANQILQSPVVALVTNGAPSNLTAPSAVVVAACMLQGRASGFFDVSFDLFFTDSAADTIVVVVKQIPLATAIAGGAPFGIGFLLENGGTAVTATGGAPVTVETLTKTTSVATSTSTSARFVVGTTAETQVAFTFTVTAGHNLSAMIFNAVVQEI